MPDSCASDSCVDDELERLQARVCELERLLQIAPDSRITATVRSELAESDLELMAIYQHLPIIMLLVDEDRRVVRANRVACNTAQRQPDESVGLRGGEMLRCVHAQNDPAGCGFGAVCQDCVVRNTILDTFRTGAAHQRVEACVSLYQEEAAVDLCVLVSSCLLTMQDKRRVMVCLEDVTENKRAKRAQLDHQSQLRSLASQVTLAEENEKQRVAEQLHDHVLQLICFAKLKLDVIRDSIQDEMAQELKQVSDYLAQTTSDIRSLTFMLSSPGLEDMGFEQAVCAWLRDEVEHKHGIKTVFLCDDQLYALEESVSLLLFRAVRELLNNAVKHAEATEIQVHLKRIRQGVQVRVRDNGLGFDATRLFTSQAPRGFGLFSVRERIKQMGGVLELDSVSGAGCTATMWVPLQVL